jgi:glyoxylase-like metal-dependent hydrolase (beta-lactamase superfamily II)
MRIHHLNCATMCPLGGSLMTGEGSVFSAARLICHCLLIESDAGLVLVDTGLGLEDVDHAPARLGRTFVAVVRPRLDPEETARRQIERLGLSPDDVRHIVVTHLDLDHAGGLSDFPRAKVHCYAPEHDAALHPRDAIERERYRAGQWAHGPDWVTHTVSGERWFEFDAVRALGGTHDEVLLVPTIGHTRGHCAVAVRAPDGWLLHCGDSYFHRNEMDLERPRCPPILAGFQRIVARDDDARVRNQARLRELRRDHGGEVRLFCAHDPRELEALQTQSDGPTSARAAATPPANARSASSS